MIVFLLLMLVIVGVQLYVSWHLYSELKRLKDAPLDNRARDGKGRFVANDPNTPENEAYKKRK
jgi:hypothetical protein